MKTIIKQTVGYAIGNKFCSSVFRFINRKKLNIIYYHRVIKNGDFVNSASMHLCVDYESFEKQMKFLSQFYNPVGERDIISAMEGKSKIPEYPVWVTFDDGYKDNYTYAYPVFKRYRIPATFFITTGFINKQVLPYEDDLFMNWEEIQEMSNHGFAIGAHTVNHNILSTLSVQEIEKEISESKYEIETKLGKEVFSFAYPRGKRTDFVGDICFPVLQSCGFKLGVTTIGGTNSLVSEKNRFTLKRMGVSYEDTLDFFKIKVSAGSFWQR